MPALGPAMVWGPDPARLRTRSVGAHHALDASTVPSDAAGPGGHAALSDLQLLRRLEASPRGLTEGEADARLARVGDNSVPERRRSLRNRVTATLRDPFTLVLAALAVASAVIGSPRTAMVVAALAAVSCLLRFHTERRGDRDAAALATLPATTATVLRRVVAGGEPLERELPARQLVPGDIVLLAPGEQVPADVLVLRADALTVGQAALTGESAPVAKHPAAGGAGDAGGDLFDCPRLCFLGSTVVSGSATVLVLATGPRTHYGADRITGPVARTSGFHREAAATTRALVWFMLLSALVLIGVNELVRDQGPAVLTLAVAVAVGLTPEMLPVVVSSALARGSALLGRRRVLVKRLPAVHDLGAMDLLCTDKTGTLTRGRPTLSGYLDPDGAPDSGVLYWAAANSLACLLHGDGTPGDPVDEAVLDAAVRLELPLDEETLEPVAVLPFTPARRRATVVLRGPGRGGHTLVAKGAPEEILGRCARIRADGGEAALDDARRARLRALVDTQAEDGVSLLAVARGHRQARLGGYGSADEQGLTLLGFVGVRDEPRSTAAAALADLAAQGVRVVVVTGDHPAVAARICRDLGLPADGPGASTGGVLTGADTDALDDAELVAIADRTTLFARMTPRHKARIVEALRRAGHTVGFLGDGVNDVPALAAADVGVCPEQAVPAARAAADAVLARKDLTALGDAVRIGRRSVGTIGDYLRIAVSANFGNALSMIAASVLLPFLPMLPGQILVQNLCFDLAQLTLAFTHPTRHPDRPDRPDRPRRPKRATGQAADGPPQGFNRRGTVRFVVCFGVLNSLTDLVAFVVLGHLTGHRHDPAAQAAFRAGWFTENLATQALAMHLLRSGGRAARPVWLGSAGLLAVGLLLPYSPLAAPLRLGGLPVVWLPLLGALLVGYAGLTLLARAGYRRWARPYQA